MRGIYKKLTFEDKFARKYYCNSYRFLPSMKRRNRKKLRRLLKIASDINVATKKEVQNDKASKPLKR